MNEVVDENHLENSMEPYSSNFLLHDAVEPYPAIPTFVVVLLQQQVTQQRSVFATLHQYILRGQVDHRLGKCHRIGVAEHIVLTTATTSTTTTNVSLPAFQELNQRSYHLQQHGGRIPIRLTGLLEVSGELCEVGRLFAHVQLVHHQPTELVHTIAQGDRARGRQERLQGAGEEFQQLDI